NYTLLRYPERKIRFYNAGQGGDTMAGGVTRLERDVFSRGATALIVAFGVNDIGWGSKADDEHRKKYLDAVSDRVAQCQKRKVRVYLCSAAVIGGYRSKGDDSFLQKMCDEGIEIARKMGEQSIDVQRTMRGIQKKMWAANEDVKDEKQKAS